MSSSSKRRRQRGTGSLRQLAAGKWQLRYKGESTLTFAESEKLAKDELKNFVSRVDNGGVVKGDRMTFNELADVYLESKARSQAPTSVRWYRRNLKQHVRPAIGPLKVRDLRPIHIQRMLDQAHDTSRTSRRGQPLRATTLRNLLIGVRAVLHWAQEQELVTRNVAARVQLPMEDHVERPQLSRAEVADVLKAAHGTELFMIVATAIATGARRGELCALRWSDLDLETGTIAIRRSVANVDGGTIEKATKTKHAQRTDHMPAFAVELLRDHKTAQLATYEQLFGELEARRRQRTGYVFARRTGEVFDPNELSRLFARLVRRHRLPHFRFHDLRHGFATLAFAAGVPLAVVSKSLGHASIGITANVYTHILTDQKREKAAVIDAYLGPALTEGIAEKTTA